MPALLTSPSNPPNASFALAHDARRRFNIDQIGNLSDNLGPLIAQLNGSRLQRLRVTPSDEQLCSPIPRLGGKQSRNCQTNATRTASDDHSHDASISSGKRSRNSQSDPTRTSR